MNTQTPKQETAVLNGVTIEQHTHTKKGFDMWIVILADRIERAEFMTLLDQAKDLNGWYSRKWGTTPAGFAFKDQTKAQEFAASLAGDDTPPTDKGTKTTDKPQHKPAVNINTAEKLEKVAANMQGAIDNKLDPNRLTNTPKRQLEAGHARQEGERLKRTQQALNGLASAHRADNVPAELEKIKSKKAVYELMGTIIERNGAYYNHGNDTGEPRDTSPAAVALWAFIKPKSADELKAEELKKKTDDLQFSKIPGYFPTQNPVIDEMLFQADIKPGEEVLEPSAGHGAIVDKLRLDGPQCSIDVYEVNHSLQDILKLKGYTLRGQDFLNDCRGKKYDTVIMNPPFENLQDIDHVMHAYSQLKAGGRLVSVMSPSPFYNSQKKAQQFRDFFIEVDGYKQDLPEGSFKASGTGVNTVLITITKA